MGQPYLQHTGTAESLEYLRCVVLVTHLGQNSKITVDEYTSGHFQGGLQLLDLVIRKWIGKKYLPPALTQNIDEQQRTAAAERAYAAYCPQLPKLRQSLATALHEPHATPPEEPWLAYPLPITEPHNLTPLPPTGVGRHNLTPPAAYCRYPFRQVLRVGNQWYNTIQIHRTPSA